MKFNNLLTFVKKYSTIKKLKLYYSYYRSIRLSKKNALQVAKALPLLSELYLFLGEKFSVDEIIRFVNDLEQLNNIYFITNEEVYDLRSKLGSKWKLSIDPDRKVGKMHHIAKCQ